MQTIKFPGQIPIEAGIRTAQDHLEELQDFRSVLEEIQVLTSISMGFEGTPGFWGYTGLSYEDNFKCEAQSSPSMRFEITPGAAVILWVPYVLTATYTSSILTAPSADDRIDTVELLYSTSGTNITARGINIIAGVEDASPSAPSVSTNGLKIAEIYHRPGESSIKDTDDSTNGYITDARVWLNV